MANKKTTYETVFELGGKIESSFGKSFKSASKQLNGLQQSSKRAEKATTGLTDALKLAAGAALAYKAFDKAVGYAGESVEAAKVQIEQETKLATVLKQRTKATDEQIQSILGLTAAQQNLGILGDEVQIAGAQQLATFVNQTDSIEALLPAMNNLLAQQKGLNASTGDAVSMGNMIGKVMNGQIGALSKAGISFTDTQEKVLRFGTESERAAMLAQVITENVGEMNEALAKTDAGKIQNATNRLGDMQEEVGKKILPLQAEFYSWFADKIPTIQNLVTSFIDKTESGFGKAKNVFNQVKPHLQALIDRFKDMAPNIDVIREHITWFKDIALEGFNKIKAVIGESSNALGNLNLEDIIARVSDAFSTLGEISRPIIEYVITEGLPGIISILSEVIVKVMEVYTFIQDHWVLIEPIVMGFVGALAVLKGALLIYKGAMLVATAVTSGFGAVVAFVTSPIGIAVLAIGALIAIGFALYKNWDKISAWLKRIFLKIKDGVVTIFNGIVEFFKEWGPLILAVLTGPFGLAIYAIVKNWDTIKAFFSGILTAIQDIFAGIGQWFGEKFQEAVTLIQGAFSGIGEFFTGLFDGVIGIFKGFVNIWISIINSMIDKINSIHIDIPDWVAEKLGTGGTIGFSIPKIPQLATGGVVTRSTILEAGEGRESEAILPLSKLQSLLDMPYINSGGGTIIYAPNITVYGNANESDIEKVLAEDKIRFERWYREMKAKEKRTKF